VTLGPSAVCRKISGSIRRASSHSRICDITVTRSSAPHARGYSPDLNPIEQVFAKLKTLLRKADPRTIETTWREIGALLGNFTPKECANYLVNAGYASA